MRITFDREADAAYIYLVPIGAGEAVRQELLDAEGPGQIIVHFNRDGHMIGVEVLSATKLLPAAVLAAAEPPRSTGS